MSVTHTFPSLCRLSEREREGMPPARRYAAMVGCPEKYLYLAETEYANEQSYAIHPYREMQVLRKDITATEQLACASSLVPFLFENRGHLFVINGHPALQETLLFLWHVVCHFAVLKYSNPIKYRECAFSFIGNSRLEDGSYQCHRQHTLALGPALDEMNNYHVTTYVETLMRFDDLNKILITSTTNVTLLLERLRIVPKNVHAFINLSERLEAAEPVVAKRVRKPSRKDALKNYVKSI
jgi:hypothetical protein